jgi:RNA polymerase sigma-70 factor (ECF subfamily)
LSDDVVEAVMAKLSRTPDETDRRQEILAGCIEKLGADAIELLRRCYIDRQKIKDVAAALNRSLTGTYSALSRIRHDLLECVQQNIQREDRP